MTTEQIILIMIASFLWMQCWIGFSMGMSFSKPENGIFPNWILTFFLWPMFFILSSTITIFHKP